jgi:hypothetical protein
MSGDIGYYRRRREQELQAAHSAPCIQTRRVHQEMAELYDKMIKVLGTAANDPL